MPEQMPNKNQPQYFDFDQIAIRLWEFYKEPDTNSFSAKDIGELATQAGLDHIRKNTDEYKRELTYIRSQSGKSLLNKLILASGDTSKEAQDFVNSLYLIAVVTTLSPTDQRDLIRLKLLFQTIADGKMHDQNASYVYLKRIGALVHRAMNRDSNFNEQEFYAAVMATLAKHPLATIEDKCKYATQLTARGRQTSDYATQIRVFQQIITELRQEVIIAINQEPRDVEKISYLILQKVQTVKKSLEDAQHVSGTLTAWGEKLGGLLSALENEFNLNEILKFAEQGRNYSQEFERGMELQIIEQNDEIAKLRAQIERLERENKSHVDENEKLKTESESLRTKNQEQEKQITDLKKQNGDLSEEYKRFMKILELKIGAIKMFLQSFNEKKKQLLNRGRDMVEISTALEKALADKDPHGYNWIKDMELQIAKLKKQEMQNLHI